MDRRSFLTALFVGSTATVIAAASAKAAYLGLPEVEGIGPEGAQLASKDQDKPAAAEQPPTTQEADEFSSQYYYRRRYRRRYYRRYYYRPRYRRRRVFFY